MAESGLLFQRFAENLTAAILPKAVAKLELRKMAARDPKRPFADVDIEKRLRVYDDKIHGGVMSKRIAIALAIVLIAKFAAAHHSDSRFDLDRVIAFEGTVEKFSWRNPHVYLTIRDANDVEWIN